MDVMEKRAAATRLKNIVEVLLARMAERRVAQVVPQRDGLDKVAVEAECATDVARDARPSE